VNEVSTSTPESTPPTSTSPPSSDLSSPSRKRSGTVSTGVAIGIAIVLLLIGFGGGYLTKDYLVKNNGTSSSTTAVQLTETGSSLLYPLMTSWAGNYSGATISAASTGSGTGQSDAEQGLVNMGASDGYVANASATSIVNFPVAISAQLIYYNLPGVSQHLNLNGSILAQIYLGTITTWNNPEILAAQPTNVQTELNGLSSTTIHPIKRADSSGDTFLFTSLCDMSYAGWTYGASTSALSGETAATGETGNSGVVSALHSTTNSIGYVGISYESSANAATPTALVYAAVGDNMSNSATGGINPANYIQPSASNISQDANLGLTRLQFSVYGLAVSLILGGSWGGATTLELGGGGSNPTTASPTPYPIVNLEYLLVKTGPTGTTVTSTTLTATVTFLEWALSTGNWASAGTQSTYITNVNFVPLTPEVTGYDLQEIASIHP
jgi:phosphate transport system substrate-binding protein